MKQEDNFSTSYCMQQLADTPKSSNKSSDKKNAIK